eukprot:7562853-Prorocentrum_lima.AAC.1
MNTDAIIGAVKTLHNKESNTLMKLDTCHTIYACDYENKHPEFRHLCESRATSLECIGEPIRACDSK